MFQLLFDRLDVAVAGLISATGKSLLGFNPATERFPPAAFHADRIAVGYLHHDFAKYAVRVSIKHESIIKYLIIQVKQLLLVHKTVDFWTGLTSHGFALFSERLTVQIFVNL